MSSQEPSSPVLAPSASPFERLGSLRLRLDWELTLYVLFIVAGAALRFWDLGATTTRACTPSMRGICSTTATTITTR
jgi:hypothetical protein